MAARNSLERVLAVLEMFTEARPEWTPDELMQALGYSRPTLYRYLKTLKDAGLLTSTPSAGFTLGPKVVEMDYLMRKADPLVREGEPHLQALALRHPSTAFLVRWYGEKILCVASECSTSRPLSSYPRGRPMPIARGAISRAIMAFLPRRRLLPLIENNLAELRAVGLGDDAAAVQDNLRQVRKAGHAVAWGEVTPGLVGIAAPIFDAGRIPIAAICISAAADGMSGAKLDAIAADIRRSAFQISAALSESRSAESA